MPDQSDAARRWQERLRRFDQAPQTTVAQFCANEGVSQPSYYHWRRKLRGPAASAKPKPGQHATRFIPVALNRNAETDIAETEIAPRDSPPRPPHACTTIELPGGVRITVEVPTTRQPQNDDPNTAPAEDRS